MCLLSDPFMSGVLPANQETCTVAYLCVHDTLFAIIALHTFQGLGGRLPLLSFEACTANPAQPTIIAQRRTPPFHLRYACTESMRHVSSGSHLLCLSLQNAASHLLEQTDALLRRLPQVQPLSGQQNATGTCLSFPDYADARYVAQTLP